MRTYLLTWNPKLSPNADLVSVAETRSAGTALKGWAWSCGNNKKIQFGDRVFLLRQGRSSPGIVASGKVVRAPYLAPHWDKAKNKRGIQCRNVKVDWDNLLPPSECLSRSRLLQGVLPSTLLKVASSGVAVHPPNSTLLESAWAAHLALLAAPRAVNPNPCITVDALIFARQFSHFDAQVRITSGGQPFTSFHAGLPAEWEDYKTGVRVEAIRLLALRSWKRSEVGSGKILSRVIRAIEINNSSQGLRNNLVQWPNRYGPKNRSHRALLDARNKPTARRALEQAFFNFFTTASPAAAAFHQFCDLIGKRYDLLAYLFFVKDWTRFMPIAPTTFDRAFKLLGVDLVTSHQCSWDNYLRYNTALAHIQTLLREVAGVDDARLVDAHSFCWMLVRLKLPAPPATITIPLPRLLSNVLPPAQPANAPTTQRTAFPIVTDEDFAAHDARRRRLGRLAQDVALLSEQRRLRELGNPAPDSQVRPVWNESGRGFDIISVEPDGTPRHIEVKAARRSGNGMSFFLSRNEWRQSRDLPNYWFYLVFETESSSPEVLMIPASELSESSLVPTDYLVSVQIARA